MNSSVLCRRPKLDSLVMGNRPFYLSVFALAHLFTALDKHVPTELMQNLTPPLWLQLSLRRLPQLAPSFPNTITTCLDTTLSNTFSKTPD